MIDFTLRGYLAKNVDLTIIPNDSAIRLGIGGGGLISQHIEPDDDDQRIWDVANSKMLNVHLINSNDFYLITGSPPPPTPVDALTYHAQNLSFPGDDTKPTSELSREISLGKSFGFAEDVAKRATRESQVPLPLSGSGHNSEADDASSKDACTSFETHEVNFQGQRPKTRVAMMDVDDTVPRFKTWASLD